ncbi:MAG: tetratricopeptide repeat protein [Elusimicrobia bacterium]|nr:tetratricopeptide repeat protein [Elusimicrobiota bacterium]
MLDAEPPRGDDRADGRGAGAVRRAAVLAAALSLSGCIATQQDILGLAQQADNLKDQVADLKTTVSSLQANQADLAVQIKQLRGDLSAYTENVRSLQGDIGALSAKLDELGSRIAGKVTLLGQTLSQAQQKNLAEEKAVLDAQRAALDAQKAALEAQKRETAATQTFLTAEKRLQAKDYAQAAAAFEDYLQRFGGGSLADLAAYDLGLSYYGLKEWEKAGRQFALVLDRYPKSGRTPGARLHYALCLLKLRKDTSETRAYLESLLADFPKSPEAAAAAAELKRLDAARLSSDASVPSPKGRDAKAGAP